MMVYKLLMMSLLSGDVVKEMYIPQLNGKISDGKITHELSLNKSLNTLPFYRIIIPKEETTLEEAAKQYAIKEDAGEGDDRKISEINSHFLEGAKWQQEKMYNEENLYSEIESLIIMWSNDGTKTAGALTRQIMEQFKKQN